jgi:hypothetical protein
MSEYKVILNSIELTILPENIEKAGISFVRHDIYHSVFRNLSLSLRFAKKTGGGGTEIIEAYNVNGISANMPIIIKKRNPQTNDYDNYYTGILDYSPDRWEIHRDFIEIAIIDGSKQQKFISRDEINFNVFQRKSADNITVNAFSQEYRNISLSPIDIILTVDQLGNTDFNTFYSVGTGLESREFYYNGTTININELGDRLKTTEDRTIEVYENTTGKEVILKITEFEKVTAQMVIDITYIIPTNHAKVITAYEMGIYDESDVLITNYNLAYAILEYTNLTPPDTGIKVIDYNLYYPNWDLNIPVGGKIKMKFRTTPEIPSWGGQQWTITMNLDHTFNFYEKTIGEPETTCKTILSHEAFTRLIQLSTSELNTDKLFYSEFFGRTDSEFETYDNNGEGSLDAITVGKLIRKFPSYPLNLSIRDLFKTFDSIYALGLGFDNVNDRFYIERIDNFYQGDYEMFDIGEVSELVIKPYKQGYYSQILGGDKNKKEYEKFQGVNEYNVPTEHSISQPVKEKEDYQSPYNTDSIGIEITRRKQYENSASEDTKHDETIYLVRTDATQAIQNGSSVTGFAGVELYYNIAFAPRERIIRHTGLIKSALYKKTQFIKYIQSQKNKNITYTNQNLSVVNETDDLESVELTKPALFIPEVYEFNSKINTSIIEILKTNPHGFITFEFDKQTYNGYVLSIEGSDYAETAKYTLLAKEVPEGDQKIFENEDVFLFEDDQNYLFE